jgi:hypothetical protein
MPVYKDDKREQRREKKALEALRAASSSALDLGTPEPTTGLPEQQQGAIMPMTLDSANFFSSSTQLPISEELVPLVGPEPPRSEIRLEITDPLGPTRLEIRDPEPMRLEIRDPEPTRLEIRDSAPLEPVRLQITDHTTPKLKLKVKTTTISETVAVPPPSATTTPLDHPSSASPSKLNSSTPKQDLDSIALEEKYDEDQIRCICANPTVDYGLFMIACDACGIWFHGSCVGMGPDTIPPGGSWFCHTCKIMKRVSTT